MDFLDYLVSLAPKGETLLLVRQKPRKENGQVLYHADGAMKCTWPAYLPGTKMPPGAWYGNTGSFILDRLGERPSAALANCEYILCMMLDDIDTKSKRPPLRPTWYMETSPGNFQYGYAFREQPTKLAFTQAMVAIAAAGYTDPGATNAVRNFRLPGSINLKPTADKFAAKLIEFDPTAEYTLPEICDALGVVPDERVSLGPRPITLLDNGADDVAAWLSDRGLVLSQPNSEGWMGVVCPQAALHTDGNPEGRYMPANRAYCCLHAHCDGYGSAEFLSWVAREGGPEHSTGLRDDLLAETMADTLAKLAPTETFPDKAAEVLAQVEAREVGRLDKMQWWQRFAYLQDDDGFFDLEDRRELSRQTFNALFRHVACKSVRTGRSVEASVCFDENRQAMGARALVGVTYAAGESVLVSREGQVYANKWRNARPQVGGAGDAGPWLAHVERMLPEKFEREHVLDVLAHKVQRPDVKINHAILHAGEQGAGKDTLYAPFLWAVGGPTHINVALVRNDDLNSQWGYAYESEVMVINELRQAEAADRRALENRLKPIIAAPPELLPVNRKGLRPYYALNRLFVLAYSNERAAIVLPASDRRWFVVWSDAGRMTPAESDRLWGWYAAGGFDAVASWLHSRDVSAFQPGAAPPMTEAKMILVEQGLSSAESFVCDMARMRRGEFASGAVGTPWHALVDRLQGSAPTGVKLYLPAVMHGLREAGWIDRGRIASADYQTKKHVFCAPELAGASKSEVRRLAEGVPEPLRMVKQG
jgi:hypothetical protein